jgi:hypothetical protein
MRLEKKLIAISILAFIIGLAIILPPYLTLGIGATAKIKPISDVDMILYAHAAPDVHINGQERINREWIDILVNFTLNPKTAMANLKDVDAQIEIYNFHVYSDQTSIANITYCISTETYVLGPIEKTWGYTSPFPTTAPGRYTSAVPSTGNGFWGFSDGSKFDLSEVIGYTEGNDQAGFNVGSISWTEEEGYSYNATKCSSTLLRGHYIGGLSAYLTEKEELSAQAKNNLENAQTLYIDVTRIMTVTYKHQNTSADSTTPATSSIKTTTTSNKVIGHIELTKTDWGFASGSIPDYMQNDSSYRYTLPPSAFLNPQLPKEEHRTHARSVINTALE